MANRAQEIAEMMGYVTPQALIEAIGEGEVILLKVPEAHQERIAAWLQTQAPEVKKSDAALGEAIHEIARALELSAALKRYPSNSDICELDLPSGWPSYCDKPTRD
ncbi:MAG: hypothetical protein RBT47_06840 [Anaerolineae bacterium]|jgi:predicted transcriptional regulator|nr:hypothetical protein [Anaerolineae bacterium]